MSAWLLSPGRSGSRNPCAAARSLARLAACFGSAALASQREHAIRLPSWQDGLAGYLTQRQAEKEPA